jgi:hypothetical protein
MSENTLEWEISEENKKIGWKKWSEETPEPGRFFYTYFYYDGPNYSIFYIGMRTKKVYYDTDVECCSIEEFGSGDLVWRYLEEYKE